MNAVEMRNVSVIRDGTVILDSLNLVLKDNESVAIIGPNGSGKTTLMKLMRGDILPYYDKRTVFSLFGETRWDLFELRSRIGIVSMDLQSRFNDVCIRDIVMSGFFSSMDVYRNHTVTDAMEKKTKSIMEFMDIEGLGDRTSEIVSLGEMRRALIARALVNDPDMLVLDEPMTGLDVKMKMKFRTLFDILIERNVNIVMITHELEDIPDGVRRVVMIKNGKVFGDGAKDEMLTSKMVSELYDLDVHVEKRSGSYHMMPGKV